METKIEFEILIPETPNFIAVISKGSRKRTLLAIEDLTNEELQNMGEQWIKNLVTKANKKRPSSPLKE